MRRKGRTPSNPLVTTSIRPHGEKQHDVALPPVRGTWPQYGRWALPLQNVSPMSASSRRIQLLEAETRRPGFGEASTNVRRNHSPREAIIFTPPIPTQV